MVKGPVIRPLSESLGLVADEIGDLARLGDALERMIARLSAVHGIADPELMADAQAADLLSQRLAGVAAFLGILARTVPSDAACDVLPAMRQLTLAEQARRLSGAEAAVAEPSGELSLFED